MKQIGSTRVVICGPSFERSADIAARLRGIGLEHVSVQSLAASALGTPAEHATVVVVDSADGTVPACPLDVATRSERRAVAVLLVPAPGHAQIKLAINAGYAAILPADVATRALYRRIGALTQKMRRPERPDVPLAEPVKPLVSLVE